MARYHLHLSPTVIEFPSDGNGGGSTHLRSAMSFRRQGLLFVLIPGQEVNLGAIIHYLCAHSRLAAKKMASLDLS